MIRLAAILTLLAGPVMAAETVISGHPEIIDGDTIKIDGVSLRLDGIDAPEMDQSLGNYARDMLIDAIKGREVVCSWNGLGRYGRPLALCVPVLASGRISTVSLNAMMVRAGAAYAGLPYGYQFERQQSLAMTACAGVWAVAGLPWCHRRER